MPEPVNSLTISIVDFTYDDIISSLNTIFDALGGEIKTIKLDRVNIYKFESFNECIEKLKNLEKIKFTNCSTKNYGDRRLVRVPSLSTIDFENSNADLLRMFENHESIREVIFVTEEKSKIFGAARLQDLLQSLPNLHIN